MLSRLSVRARLLVTFGALLVLLLVVAGAGLFGVFSARQGLQQITVDMLPVQHDSELALRAMLRSRIAEQTMVANNLDNTSIGEHKKSWDGWLQQAHAHLQKVKGMLAQPGDQERIDTITRRIEAYRATYEAFHKDLLAAKFPDAKEAVATMAPVDRAFADLESEFKLHQDRVDELSRDIDASVGRMVTSVAATLAVVAAAALAVGVTVALVVSRSIVKPLSEARTHAEHISRGDLTRNLQVAGSDEAAQTLVALQAMTEGLRRIVSEVRAGASSIQLASGEVASGNVDLSQRTERTAANVQHAAGAIDMLSGSVRQSADSAQTASRLANNAAEVAQRGGAVVADVIETMNGIQASSEKIRDIIGVIDGIAFQTNILALNAAVEAARAGDQGRGFAVVAEEVRTLARGSAEAARQIKDLISASVERVDAGSRLVENAGTTMQEIVSSVGRVNEIMGEISSAVGQQSSGITQVSGTVSDIDQMTQQNAALVEQSAAAADSLKDQADRLVSAVASFRLQ